MDDDMTTPGHWSGVLAPMNTESGDGRVLVLADGTDPQVRPLPLPLCAQREIGEGHDGGEVVGRITEVWVQDGLLMGAGDFDLADPVAQEWARKIADGFAGWVSVDLDAMHMTAIPRDTEGNVVDVDALMAELEEDPDLPVPEMGEPLLQAESWRLMGATLVSGPAFAEAKITTTGTPATMATKDDDEDETEEREEEEGRGPVPAGEPVPTGNGEEVDPPTPPESDDTEEDPEEEEEDDDDEKRPSFGNSGMVALVPSAPDAARLAVDNGLAVDDLHLTLAYLGDDVGNLSDDQVAALVEAVTATGMTTVDGEVFGTAQFNPTGPEPCSVYLVEAPGLTDLRASLVDALGSVIELPQSHDGFVPHVTAGYGIDPSTLGDGGSIRFDRLRVAVGDRVTDVPLEPVTANLTAAAIVYDADHFSDPGLSGPTALQVTDDGRIYGHLATWGTCHVGFADRCVTPPASPQLYRYFHRGLVDTTEGVLPVGLLTMDTGHATLGANRVQALSHYDDTGTQVAVVRAGEDAHGIWVAGHTLPGVGPDQIDKLRRSSVSGDWRGINGNRELVAALVVNVPGFPIPQAESLVASGADTVVAAGVVLPTRRKKSEKVPNDLVSLVASATANAQRQWDKRQEMLTDTAAQVAARRRRDRLATLDQTVKEARLDRARRRVTAALGSL